MKCHIERIQEQLFRSKRLKCDYQEAECKSTAEFPVRHDIETLLKRFEWIEKEHRKVSDKLNYYESLAKERKFWATKYIKECMHWRKGIAQCMHCKRPFQP